jgi:hypothetical protein
VRGEVLYEGHFPHSHSPTLSVSILFPRSFFLIEKHKQKENENESDQRLTWEHLAHRTYPLNAAPSFSANAA